MKLLPGIDRTENGSLNLLGNLEAEGVVAGAFTVKVTDEEIRTIGQVAIKAGEKNFVVKTKAVDKDSRILATPVGKEPVSWIISDVNNGEGFTISLDKAADNDINFDWWIVEEK